jgi:beta-lactam-binding protein with PASTA domain
LENNGYNVTFEGYGKVVSQEPAAGTKLERGTTVRLILKEK